MKLSKSSVIFIDEESYVPGWEEDYSRKSSQTSFNRISDKFKGYKGSFGFPSTFRNYLLSQESVVVRLLSSLLPPFGKFKRIAVDPQGTFLSIFILSSVIYWGFVSSRGIPRAQALMYSAAMPLVYVMLLTLGILLMRSVTKTIITFRQVFCIVGYGLFGHAITLLLCEVSHDEWFLTALTVFGGLATGRLCFVLLSRTPKPALRFVICTPVAIAHLLYSVYLHFTVMRN